MPLPWLHAVALQFSDSLISVRAVDMFHSMSVFGLTWPPLQLSPVGGGGPSIPYNQSLVTDDAYILVLLGFSKRSGVKTRECWAHPVYLKCVHRGGHIKFKIIIQLPKCAKCEIPLSDNVVISPHRPSRVSIQGGFV